MFGATEASPAAPVAARRRRLVLAWAAVATILLAVAYGRALPGEFVWDDAYLVLGNRLLSSPDAALALFRSELSAGTEMGAGNVYRPLPMLTLWAQVRLGGMNLGFLRAGNVAIHGVVGLLLLLFLLRLGASRPVAFSAAAAFLVHPIAAEPVQWLAGRFDLLGTAFTLGAALAWPLPGDRRPVLWAAVAAIAAAAAMLCKEPYVIAPVLVGLAAAATPGEGARNGRRLLLAVAVPATGTVAALLLRWNTGIPVGATLLAVSPLDHVRTLGTIAAHYAPPLATFDLGPTIQSYRPLGTGRALAVLGAVAAVAGGLVVAAVRGWRGAALALLGLAWAALALIPLCLAVPLSGLWGNRYAYPAWVGACLVLAAAAEAAIRPLGARPRRWMAVAVALAAIVVALRTSVVAGRWHDALELFGADRERAPDDPQVLYHFGTAVRRRRGCAEALPSFEEAARLDPSFGRAWHNVAGCLLQLGRPGDALPAARMAVELNPASARAHYNLGLALRLVGRPEEGRASLERALGLDPGHEPSRRALAEIGAPSPEEAGPGAH